MPLHQATVTNSELKATAAKPNFGNDYCSYYHTTGVLPQEHITNAEDPYKGYPKLQKLQELKEEHNKKYVSPIVGQHCLPANMPEQLRELASSRVQFDVIMIGGCTNEFNKAELAKLPIEKLGPRPSILYLWVPSWKLDEGRELLDKWGYRRSEDIVFAISSQNSVFSVQRTAETKNLVLKPTTWHCFMGLKGTLRRSDDGHLINCNVDTDVVLESTATRPNVVPEQIYQVVERFTSMNRRVHIVPFHSPEHLPVRLRKGWAMITPDTMLQNLEPQDYMTRVCVPVDPEIDLIRPKTPPRTR